MPHSKAGYKKYYEANKAHIMEVKKANYMSRVKLIAQVEALEKVIDELEDELDYFRTITATKGVKRIPKNYKNYKENLDPPTEIVLPKTFHLDFA